MVFLTSIDILDTGFITKAKTGTQLSTAMRVNSGQALRLKGVNFDISGVTNLDKSSILGKYDTQQVPTVSINPDEFTLTIKFNKFNTDTNNAFAINDMSLLKEIIRINKTLGLKAIYYPIKETLVGTDDRNRASQMIWQLGAVDTIEPQGDITISLWDGEKIVSSQNLTHVRYLSTKIESFRLEQTPDNLLTLTLTGVITI